MCICFYYYYYCSNTKDAHIFLYLGAAARLGVNVLSHVCGKKLVNTECGGGDKLHPAERVFGYHGPLWLVSLCAWPRLNGRRQGAVS